MFSARARPRCPSRTGTSPERDPTTAPHTSPRARPPRRSRGSLGSSRPCGSRCASRSGTDYSKCGVLGTCMRGPTSLLRQRSALVAEAETPSWLTAFAFTPFGHGFVAKLKPSRGFANRVIHDRILISPGRAPASQDRNHRLCRRRTSPLERRRMVPALTAIGAPATVLLISARLLSPHAVSRLIAVVVALGTRNRARRAAALKILECLARSDRRC